MKKFISFIIPVMLSTLAYCQPKYSVSGYITDKNTGEVLIGALLEILAKYN